MRTLGPILKAIFALAIGILAAGPADATIVVVLGSGTALGTTTTYTCTQFPNVPPNCPSTTSPDQFPFNFTVSVDTDALAIAPASFSSVQVGIFYFADFSIALVGTDQWGNYLFQGQGLTVQGTSNLHPCFNGVYPCTGDSSTFSAPIFAVQQLQPPPVPEPATWLTMLVGFALLRTLLRFSKGQLSTRS